MQLVINVDASNEVSGNRGWGNATLFDCVYVIIENHFGRLCVTCRVQRAGIWCSVLHAWYVDDFEVIPQGLLLEVP